MKSVISEKIIQFYLQKRCGIATCSRHFCTDVDTIYNIIKGHGISILPPSIKSKKSNIRWDKRRLLLLQERLIKAHKKLLGAWKRKLRKPKNIRSAAQKEIFYSDWKITVLVRDNFICQDCRDEEIPLTSLEVHHILSWKDNINHRYDPDNGITLCKSCHRIRHKKAV